MDFPSRLARIEERISEACRKAGRCREEVQLIAISKNFGGEAIWEAYQAGLRHFGESRLQEAIPKIEALPKDIVWHFVGRLQTNKAKRVAELFPAIHSLENERQLAEISKADHKVDCLIELNLGQETQKSGVFPSNLAGMWKTVLQFPQVRFRGLMAIGPALDDPEAMRPYFRELRRLGETVGAEWLSMGMSDNFEVAIQEGATHIRIGTALFGDRS